MSIKSMIPNMTEAVKVVIVVTVLAITGIGAAIVAKTQGLIRR